MIPKSLPSDLIRGWGPVFGKDHAQRLKAGKRRKSVERLARGAPAVDRSGFIGKAQGHAGIDHELIGEFQEIPHGAVEGHPSLLRAGVQAVTPLGKLVRTTRRKIAGRAGSPDLPPKTLAPPRRLAIPAAAARESIAAARRSDARPAGRRRPPPSPRARRARSRRSARCARAGSLMATSRTHSAPARVLPAPRPPRMSQVVQGSPLLPVRGLLDDRAPRLANHLR